MFYIKRISRKFGKKLIKRVVPKSWRTLIKWTVRPLRDRVLFEYRLRNHTPVFIYQMGKVASKSVYNSLLNQYPGVVCHAHYFSPEHTNWQIRRLYHWVMERKRPLNIISITREPIGRNVSAFFQNFERIVGVPYSKADFSVEELKSVFLTKYRHEKALRWFDKNLKKNFDFDVYANSFAECGYAKYLHNNIRLLVMRSELSDREKSKVLDDFMGLSEFQMVNNNIGDEKEYGLGYKNFKTNVKLPIDYIDKMCKSKYFNHFYDKDYIDSIRKKWSEG